MNVLKERLNKLFKIEQEKSGGIKWVDENPPIIFPEIVYSNTDCEDLISHDYIVISGATGTGKTTLLKSIAEATSQYKLIDDVDYMNESSENSMLELMVGYVQDRQPFVLVVFHVDDEFILNNKEIYIAQFFEHRYPRSIIKEPRKYFVSNHKDCLSKRGLPSYGI